MAVPARPRGNHLRALPEIRDRHHRSSRGFAGIDWAACPADWGFETPIQCGYVTVPVNYAKPNGKTTPSTVQDVQNWLGTSGTACGNDRAWTVDTSRQGDALSKMR